MNHRRYHHPRTFADFYAEFLIRLTECRTCKDAYFRTERSSVEEYNRPKFVTYNAFKMAKCRHIKRIRNEKQERRNRLKK